MDRSITVPQPLAEAIDELAQRYAVLTGDSVAAARRLIEISVLQRGCLAVQRDLDQVTAPSGERVA